MKLTGFFLFLQLWAIVDVSLSLNVCSKVPDIPHGHVSTETTKSEYQEGDVIHFSCDDGYIADLTTKYVCTTEGWLVIRQGTCYSCSTLPNVPHARLAAETRRDRYREGNVVHFTCDPGFSSKLVKYVCTSEGWLAIRQGSCSETKCKLDMPPLRGTTYKPAYKSVFFPGEKVTVTCEDTYWIGRTDQTSKEITCKENGEWTVRPVCQEFICSRPRNTLVQSWDAPHWEQQKIGDTANYRCNVLEYGRVAVCTIDGWTPKPLCRGYSWVSSKCKKKSIENAYIANNDKARYNDGEEVQYTCRNSGKRFTITCKNGAWTGIEQCPSVPVPCPKATIPNGFVAGPYKNTIYYTCDRGYKFPTESWWAAAKCRDGVWSGLQRCIEETKCGEPPEIPNGVATEHPQRNEEAQILVITCQKGFSADIDQLTCQDKKWHSNGVPFETLCKPIAPLCSPPPRVENAVVLGAYRKEYISNSVITYTCRENFTMKGEDKIRCNAGKWEEKNTTCIHPTGCGNPPPLDGGDTKETVKFQYRHTETVEYDCHNYYVMEGEPHKTCFNGEWRGDVKCLKPCKVNRDAMNRRNIEFKYSYGNKLYSRHNDEIEFRCKRGTSAHGSVMRVRCLDGDISLPTCQ